MSNDTNNTFPDLLAVLRDPRSGCEGPFLEIHDCLSMIWERLDSIEARIAPIQDFDFADAADLGLWRNDCTDRGWQMPAPRHGALWTEQETADLLAVWGALSVEEIATFHGRSVSAIEKHFAANSQPAEAAPAAAPVSPNFEALIRLGLSRGAAGTVALGLDGENMAAIAEALPSGSLRTVVGHYETVAKLWGVHGQATNTERRVPFILDHARKLIAAQAVPTC